MVEYTKPEAFGLKVHILIFSPSYNEKKIAYYVPLVTREESLMTYENKLKLEKHLKAVILGLDEDTMGELEIKAAINRAINGFFEGKLEYIFSVYSTFSYRVDPSAVQLVTMVKKIEEVSYIINLIFSNNASESFINNTIEALNGLYNIPGEVVLDSEKLLETLRSILSRYYSEVCEEAGVLLARAHPICVLNPSSPF